MSDIPTIGQAAKAFLAKTANTVFNPAGIPKAKPKDLGSIIAGIKPPDFSVKPIGQAAAMNKREQVFAAHKTGISPRPPVIELPNFSGLIPKIKIDKL